MLISVVIFVENPAINEHCSCRFSALRRSDHSSGGRPMAVSPSLVVRADMFLLAARINLANVLFVQSKSTKNLNGHLCDQSFSLGLKD